MGFAQSDGRLVAIDSFPGLECQFHFFSILSLGKKKSLITVLGEQVAFLQRATTIRNTGWYAGWNVTGNSWSSRSPVSRFWRRIFTDLWPPLRGAAARTWRVLAQPRNSITSLLIRAPLKVAWSVCLAEKITAKRSMKCVCLLMKGQVNCRSETCSAAEMIIFLFFF